MSLFSPVPVREGRRVDRRAAPGPTQPRARLAGLDGLRFLCALTVVLYHYTARTSAQVTDWPHLATWTRYGALGVHIFFLISGYVILMTAWRADIPKFVASRVSRLFPAFWVCVLITAVVNARWLSGSYKDGWHGVLLNLSMTHEAFGAADVDGVYWTLYVELLFYLMMAMLIAVGLTRGRVLALCLLWPLVAQICQQHGSELGAALLQPSYAPLFCAGMVIYLIQREGPSTVLGLLLGYQVVMIAWLSRTVYGPFLVKADVAKATGLPAASPDVTFVIICAGIVALLVLSCTRVGTWSAGWLSFLGLLTYPLYLLHEHIGWWLIDVLGRHGLSVAVATAVTVLAMMAAAAVVHVTTERPLAPRLRRALESGLRQPPQQIEPAA